MFQLSKYRLSYEVLEVVKRSSILIGEPRYKMQCINPTNNKGELSTFLQKHSNSGVRYSSINHLSKIGEPSGVNIQRRVPYEYMVRLNSLCLRSNEDNLTYLIGSYSQHFSSMYSVHFIDATRSISRLGVYTYIYTEVEYLYMYSTTDPKGPGVYAVYGKRMGSQIGKILGLSQENVLIYCTLFNTSKVIK